MDFEYQAVASKLSQELLLNLITGNQSTQSEWYMYIFFIR